MPWLKDLANGRSYARVVAQMQEHASWPSSSNSSQHIANMVRKLDRRERVSWWIGDAGRVFIPALSYSLGLSESVLAGKIRAMASAEQPESVWSFSLFPGLQQIDLSKDQPYPGIPRLFFQSDGPDFSRLWWQSRLGIDSRLVSQWLCVRQGWTQIHAQDWSSVQSQLRGHERVVVSLDEVPSASVSLSSLPAGLDRLIVICEHSPPTSRTWRNANSELEPSGGPVDAVNWRIVRTSSPSSWIEPLLGWISVRLKAGVDIDLMQIRLHLLPILDDVFESPGDVLDFLGMLDASGGQIDDFSDQIGVVEHWVQHVSERLEDSGDELVRSILRGNKGIALLLRLESRRLQQGLPASLSSNQWSGLLTTKATDVADLERIYALLQQGGAEAHQQAMQLLRPDSDAIVRYLHRIGLLVANADGTLRFGPRWLHCFLHRSVIVDQVDAGPLSWGELALHKEGAHGIQSELMRRVRRGKVRWLERLVGSYDPSFPEYQAAVVLAVEVMGHAVATSGVRHRELLTRLWAHQERGLIRRNQDLPPEPLVGFPEGGLPTWGRWIFSSLWISHRLAELGETLRPAPLSPWGWDMLSSERLGMVGDVLRFCGGTVNPLDPPDTPTRHAAYALGGAILQKFGPLRSRGEFPPVLYPSVLVDAVRWGVKPVEDVAWYSVCKLDFGLDVLEEECQKQGVLLSAVLAWCWRVWVRDPITAPPWAWLNPSRTAPKDPAVLWINLPAGLVDSNLFTKINACPELWGWLKPSVWSDWGDVFCAQTSRVDLDPTIWVHVPWSCVQRILLHINPDCLNWESVVGIWDQWPNQMRSLVLALVKNSDQQSSRRIVRLLENASEAGHMWALSNAQDWLIGSEPRPAVQIGCLQWLVGVVQQRRPGWRDVFFLLSEQDKPITHFKNHRLG